MNLSVNSTKWNKIIKNQIICVCNFKRIVNPFTQNIICKFILTTKQISKHVTLMLTAYFNDCSINFMFLKRFNAINHWYNVTYLYRSAYTIICVYNNYFDNMICNDVSNVNYVFKPLIDDWRQLIESFLLSETCHWWLLTLMIFFIKENDINWFPQL
jgi:hypothetical protein